MPAGAVCVAVCVCCVRVRVLRRCVVHVRVGLSEASVRGACAFERESWVRGVRGSACVVCMAGCV